MAFRLEKYGNLFGGGSDEGDELVALLGNVPKDDTHIFSYPAAVNLICRWISVESEN